MITGELDIGDDDGNGNGNGDIEGEEDFVVLENAGNVFDYSGTSDDMPLKNLKRLIMSLVNIQEEVTLKNMPAFRKESMSDARGISYKEPPAFLNLYVMIAANNAYYSTALKHLSLAIQYFQFNHHFKFTLNPIEAVEDSATASLLSIQEQLELDIKFELQSLTFEQINYLWGTLGGKQVPFVLYKMSIIRIDEDQKKKGGGVIEKIESRIN